MRKTIYSVFFLTLFLVLIYPKTETKNAKRYVPPTISVKTLTEPPVAQQKGANGVASYYDYTLDSGWSSIGHYVCATRDFKRYYFVKVVNIKNGKSVECCVTDYGPDESLFPERIVDLSSTSFNKISSTSLGIIDVAVYQLTKKCI